MAWAMGMGTMMTMGNSHIRTASCSLAMCNVQCAIMFKFKFILANSEFGGVIMRYSLTRLLFVFVCVCV